MNNDAMSEDAEAYKPLTMDDWCDVGRVARRCCPHCYDRVLKERDEARARLLEYQINEHRITNSHFPERIGKRCLKLLIRREIEALIDILGEGRAVDEWGEEEKR